MHMKRLFLAMALPALLGLAGCESMPVVPSTAMQVGSGSGAVSYRAGEAGVLYVFDASSNQVIYSGPVERNQLVLVDPAAGRVMIDSRVAVERPLGLGDSYMLYLDRSAPRRHDEGSARED